MSWPVTTPSQPAVGSAAQASWADAVAQALAVFGPSTGYTPTWTSSGTAPSLGNGTLSGNFWQFGKLVIGRLTLTIGSTTSGGTGNWFFSLPVTAVGSVAFQDPIGDMIAKQSTSASGATAINSTTTLQCVTSALATVGATVPAAWASGNSLHMRFQYESA